MTHIGHNVELKQSGLKISLVQTSFFPALSVLDLNLRPESLQASFADFWNFPGKPTGTEAEEANINCHTSSQTSDCKSEVLNPTFT